MFPGLSSLHLGRWSMFRGMGLYLKCDIGFRYQRRQYLAGPFFKGTEPFLLKMMI
jgi:hypothetical protein